VPAEPMTVVPPGDDGTVILYLHGSHDLATGPERALDTARELAAATGSKVVVARYGPSFPGALLDDVHAAHRYCRSISDTGPVSVVAERMGATLAASLLLHLRDAGAEQPRRAVLVQGLLDLTLQANSVSLNVRADTQLDADDLRRRVTTYAGTIPVADPALSPVHANLHGLAPVQLLAAGTDLLLDDSLSFAARAARSGVSVDVRVWPESSQLTAERIGAAAGFLTRPAVRAGVVA
jgi:monoterpene epsilon-lactone hydrolase